jgi:uncharacterized protein (TIRG00374 family)
MAERPKLGRKKRFLLILVAVLVLVLLIIWAQPGAVVKNIRDIDISILAFAIILNIFTTGLLLLRWSILYQEISPTLSITDSSKVYMIGQFTNQIAPMGTGEITRAYIGSRYFNINFSKTLVSAVIERMSDIMFFLIIAAICFTVIIPSGKFYIQLGFFIAFSVLGFIFVFRPHTMDKLFFRLEKSFKRGGSFRRKLSTKLISSWETFKNSMYAYHKRKLVLFATGAFTVMIWLMDAMTQYVLFQAFGIYIPYFYVLAIVSVSFIIGALSFLPGGLAAREGSFAYLTVLILTGISAYTYGDAKAIGLAVALVYKLIVYIVIGTAAGLSFFTLPKKKKRK